MDKVTDVYIKQLEKDRDYLNWLERFLQMGGAGIFTTTSCQAHETRPDDTPETDWNHPFAIGYSVEIEDGCQRWEELSNGAKGIRPAIAAARAKLEEIRPKESDDGRDW